MNLTQKAVTTHYYTIVLDDDEAARLQRWLINAIDNVGVVPNVETNYLRRLLLDRGAAEETA